MTQTKTKTNPETKAVQDWVDWLIGCTQNDDGTFDEFFLKEVNSLLKRSKGDLAKFAYNYVKQALRENGYHDFSNSEVGFLDEFRDEGLKRVDWLVIGQYFTSKVKLS